MSQPKQGVPPHLITHYKILDLPIGAPFKDVQNRYHQLRGRLYRSKGRHKGEAAYKFLPKLEKAFQSLKQAHFDPEGALRAPSHQLRNVQNASSCQPDQSQPNEKMPEAPHASDDQMSGVVQKNLNFMPMRLLDPAPKYQPQNHFIHQARHRMAPGFSIINRSSNIFDAVEDRSVIIRKSAIHPLI